MTLYTRNLLLQAQNKKKNFADIFISSEDMAVQSSMLIFRQYVTYEIAPFELLPHKYIISKCRILQYCIIQYANNALV